MSTTIAAPRPVEDSQEPANPRAVMGDNRPPIEEQGLADFNDAIDKHAGLRQRINDLLGSSERAKATNDEEAGRCAELIRQMAAVEGVVESERKAVKEPYLNAGRKIDDAAKTFIGKVSTAKANVRSMTETYMRDKAAKEAAELRRLEEKQRREREALEAKAREEAAKAAEENREPDPEVMEAPISVSARPVAQEATQVRSDFGAMASTRKVKVAIITDWAKAFKAVKSVPAVQEAVQKAVNALVRAGQTNIPGVEVKDDVSLMVR